MMHHRFECARTWLAGPIPVLHPVKKKDRHCDKKSRRLYRVLDVNVFNIITAASRNREY
jgi:hypothetical protein